MARRSVTARSSAASRRNLMKAQTSRIRLRQPRQIGRVRTRGPVRMPRTTGAL